MMLVSFIGTTFGKYCRKGEKPPTPVEKELTEQSTSESEAAEAEKDLTKKEEAAAA